MSKGTSSEINCLASCLDLLEKIYNSSEVNDYGNIIIPEHSYPGDFYNDILNQTGYTKRVIGSNLSDNLTGRSI